MSGQPRPVSGQGAPSSSPSQQLSALLQQSQAAQNRMRQSLAGVVVPVVGGPGVPSAPAAPIVAAAPVSAPTDAQERLRQLLAASAQSQQSARARIAPVISGNQPPALSNPSAPAPSVPQVPAPSVPPVPGSAQAISADLRRLLEISRAAQERSRQQLASLVGSPQAPVPPASIQQPQIVAAPPPPEPAIFPERSTQNVLQQRFARFTPEQCLNSIAAANARYPVPQGQPRVAIAPLREYLGVIAVEHRQRATDLLNGLPAEGVSRRAFDQIKNCLHYIVQRRRIDILSAQYPYNRELNPDGNCFYYGFVMMYLNDLKGKTPQAIANKIQGFETDGIDCVGKDRVIAALRQLRASRTTEQLNTLISNPDLMRDFVRYFRIKASHHMNLQLIADAGLGFEDQRYPLGAQPERAVLNAQGQAEMVPYDSWDQYRLENIEREYQDAQEPAIQNISEALEFPLRSVRVVNTLDRREGRITLGFFTRNYNLEQDADPDMVMLNLNGHYNILHRHSLLIPDAPPFELPAPAAPAVVERPAAPVEAPAPIPDAPAL